MNDSSSLVLSDLSLNDEGKYQCHVKVWRQPNINDTIDTIPVLPEEQNVEIDLIVNGKSITFFNYFC